jgi:hypothetical protein
MGRFDNDYKLDGRKKCARPFSGGRAFDFQIVPNSADSVMA